MFLPHHRNRRSPLTGGEAPRGSAGAPSLRLCPDVESLGDEDRNHVSGSKDEWNEDGAAGLIFPTRDEVDANTPGDEAGEHDRWMDCYAGSENKETEKAVDDAG
jgi:hypothetical protein